MLPAIWLPFNWDWLFNDIARDCMKLREMKVGESGTVLDFNTSDPQYRQKLLRMGLTRNAGFTVVRKAPFGGPIEIEVKGFRLVLRSNEADALEVETK